MIDIYAVVALVGIMIGFITVIGVVIGTMLWLRSDIKAAKTELKSDISELKTELKSDISELKTELKSDIKAIDERQRRMENDISFIRGALAVAIPGFKEGMEGMEELVAEASEEESVSEAVGD